MAFDERIGAAFGAASDTVKQLLALATASIGGAIALFDDGAKAGIDFGPADLWVRIGLMLLAFSVLGGLMALGAIAGQLGSDKVDTPNSYAPGLRRFYGLQLLAYGLGVVALVVHAVG
ncbi:hypothetical protein ASD67_09100 [Sphingopyxis sp. Root1497]|uniref:hypothetical protein n=1 Tax=Sphingopyxis sp. Root1497 TaxID=1736474 RepID=UPI0006FD0603|nr:hypothetical protein [Sphingopyxis sp. Root1497]KQZ64602.1 hypothetical protein ASD67_09100 [Sphingopyxis sp. Root1497]